MTEGDCNFCNIAAGTRPCHKVLETDAVLAFMDIFPATEGHTLVIPKLHFETVFEISQSAMQAVSLAAGRIAAAMRAELVPRIQGESMRLHGSSKADPARLEALARAFAARL